MKILVFITFLELWIQLTSGMTISDGEDAQLPDELKPIVRGGSWFDDTAIERLKTKHQKLKESGEIWQ